MAESWATIEEGTELVISLYAVSEISTSDTMCLKVDINGHKLLALVDSGSMDNFVMWYSRSGSRSNRHVTDFG